MKIRSLWMLAVFILLSSAAYADPIGPTGCVNTSCQGSIYTLTLDALHPLGGGVEEAHVSYSIDTTNYNGGGIFLDTVAIKVAPFVTSASDVMAPAGTGTVATSSDGAIVVVAVITTGRAASVSVHASGWRAGVAGCVARARVRTGLASVAGIRVVAIAVRGTNRGDTGLITANLAGVAVPVHGTSAGAIRRSAGHRQRG